MSVNVDIFEKFFVNPILILGRKNIHSLCDAMWPIFGTSGLTLAGVLEAERGWRELESFRSSANPLQTDSSNPATFGFEITT